MADFPELDTLKKSGSGILLSEKANDSEGEKEQKQSSSSPIAAAPKASAASIVANGNAKKEEEGVHGHSNGVSDSGNGATPPVAEIPQPKKLAEKPANGETTPPAPVGESQVAKKKLSYAQMAQAASTSPGKSSE